MAKNLYWAYVLTGGGAGALDKIDGSILNDWDAAIVIKLGFALFYSLDVDSGAAESSPDVIAPDTNAGNKRWILTGISEIPAGAMKQLKNIGTTTISAPQWGYVGAMDQGIATGDFPSFATLLAGTKFKITTRASIYSDIVNVSLADDTVWEPSGVAIEGILLVTTWAATACHTALIAYRPVAGSYCRLVAGDDTEVTVGTTRLTDGVTDGVDGKLNVYAADPTYFGIKNRTGGTRNISLWFWDRYP